MFVHGEAFNGPAADMKPAAGLNPADEVSAGK
jgi:hypothetical protein